MKLDTLFYSIGLFISNHPVKVIIVSISIMTIILSGLMFLEFEVLVFL